MERESNVLGNGIKTIDEYSKEQLYDMAFFEPVTHYYNWNWMREKLTNYEKYGIDDFVLVHFDVKDFKMVNEIYGHEVGDDMLRRVCKNLGECDWAYFSCRCDNDNFAIMAHKLPEEEQRAKIEELFRKMDSLEVDSEYPIYFRCGVASIDNIKDYRANVTDLAKIAQHRGTRANVTEIHFYTDEMKEEELRSKHLKNDLNRAFEEHEMIVYYQPKFNPHTGKVIGAEALIRWNYHHEKLLPPSQFVPYFEKEGTIERIDRFVLEEVCRKQEQWKREGKTIVPISVNMSRAQLYSPVMIPTILEIVNRYDIDRDYIEFELTESLAYYDSAYMLDAMKKLRDLGFLLSMDDFGTGYSSLNLLSNMPLTTLKIDKSFVDVIEQDENSRVDYIVQNILDITKHLQIHSVAEGVETKNQNDLLAKWGCDFIQGYFYSKPIPCEDFEKMLMEE